MPSGSRSSRNRFRAYLIEVRNRLAKGKSRDGDSSPPASPGDAAPKRRHRPFFVLLRSFLALLRGNKLTLALALITLTISTLLMLIPPAAPKVIVDYVLGDLPLPSWAHESLGMPTDRRSMLAVTAVGVILFTVAAVIIGMIGRWQATKIAVRFKPALRRRIFDHAVQLPLHRVYQLKTGGATSILREDTGSVADLIFGLVYNPWRALVQLVGSLVVLASVDWRLLLGSLLVIPIVWVTHRTWINRIRPLYRDIHQTRQTIDSHTTETFGGIRVVRGFGRQRAEASRYIHADQFRARQESHVWWWSRAVDIAWAVLIPAASAILLWYGGLQVLKGDLTIGDLVMFLTYMTMLLDPIAVLAQSATALQTGLAALDRILDLLEEPLDMPAAPDAFSPTRASVAGRISFEAVSFGYPGTSSPVLHEISLNVNAGQMIALVGPSGAGKTTLCNLVARFYDPTAGRILLDGRDLRQLDVRAYRRLLAIVEQDIFLFDGTIAANIGYGRRDATLAMIVHAARQANAEEFIAKFDKGYDTLIGERGVKLSGGQRQRLAIARAILADPRILILDEATSNLDTDSERLIQLSLRTLMRGRTSFVIAHRLSTIMHADLIVVLENGRVVETGTHDQLMALSGRYRHMVLLQTTPQQAPLEHAMPPA